MRREEPLRSEEEIAPGAVSLDLSLLPRERRAAMRAAAAEVRECLRVLRKAGVNVVGEVLRGQGTFREYDHYPKDDVYDAESHAQYYYHAHRGLAGEHGHFHTFMRAGGMPAGVEPADIPHAEPWPEGNEALAHLIAVSMDAYGMPIGLFVPNRWVSDDTWYPALDVIAMLEGFRIDHAAPSWPVNRWLGAMLVLYRPHIEALLAERDRVIDTWRAALPHEDVLERRELEILAYLPISLEETFAQLEELS